MYQTLIQTPITMEIGTPRQHFRPRRHFTVPDVGDFYPHQVLEGVVDDNGTVHLIHPETRRPFTTNPNNVQVAPMASGHPGNVSVGNGFVGESEEDSISDVEARNEAARNAYRLEDNEAWEGWVQIDRTYGGEYAGEYGTATVHENTRNGVIYRVALDYEGDPATEIHERYLEFTDPEADRRIVTLEVPDDADTMEVHGENMPIPVDGDTMLGAPADPKHDVPTNEARAYGLSAVVNNLDALGTKMGFDDPLSARYGADADLVRDEGTKGVKKDKGKPRMDLLPVAPLMGAAGVLTFGSDKYDRDEEGNQTSEVYLNNWRQGMRWGRAYASLQRHLAAFWQGEDFDPETGMLHIDHALANVLMLGEYARTFPQGDDRAAPWRRYPVVGFDVDGVLCNTYPVVLDRALERGDIHGPHANGQMPHYAFGPKLIEALKSLGEQDYIDMEPMIDGTAMPMEPAVYVTARPPELVAATEQWLEVNGFPQAPVVSCHDKVAVLREYGVEIFLEDRYENFLRLQQVGITTFLLDQPYNRKHNVGMYRVTDVHDFARRIGMEVSS
jgi:hypothetical protein